MKPLTRKQREALWKLYQRTDMLKTYLQFRRTAHQTHMDCVMVPWCGMFVGIEPDGYAHS